MKTEVKKFIVIEDDFDYKAIINLDEVSYIANLGKVFYEGFDKKEVSYELLVKFKDKSELNFYFKVEERLETIYQDLIMILI